MLAAELPQFYQDSEFSSEIRPSSTEFHLVVWSCIMATVAPSMTVSPPQPDDLQATPSVVRWRRTRRYIAWVGDVCEWLAGLVGLIIGLSILATIPILQFISLGYLLEASSRVVRSGRLRDGFPGVRLAAKLATVGIAGWLLLLPVRAVADLQYSAELLGNGRRATFLACACGLILCTVSIHFLSACWRGGRLRSFLWPAPVWLSRHVRSGLLWQTSRDDMFETFSRLRLPRLFKLGLSGFLVAAIWLVVPISVIVTGTRFHSEPAVIISMIGVLLLSVVLLYLPFLQLNYATSGQIRAGFDIGLVKDQFRKAPIAFWLALFATLALALPLYILKAELLPREAAWLPSIVFVVSILPARLLAGWAIARAGKRETQRHFLFRHASRLLAVPVVLIYGGIVYLTQFISWHGAWSLYEQHAFMLPVPFVGM
jgi:hypothetical protein